ncbi:hypothetical protein B4U80_10519 [Leptotrombidium deliense]|uniref:Uncharacterized protein n=1 Tax=Leptotrombidium deliense TaxID=299467 RepID=A0A443RVB2_9ACAR|nr:hypothetical protein B4U80_10519 [Leptotrombidium deliense]
MTSDPKTLFIM